MDRPLGPSPSAARPFFARRSGLREGGSRRRAAVPGFNPGMRRYSLFVGAMKLLLPTLAAGLIVLLAVWSRINLDESRFRIGLSDFAPGQIESLNMVNARYDGVDSQDQPFSVTAEVVTQIDRSADVIELQRPTADLTLSDGAWIALTADSGTYRRTADLLDLAGSVSLYHDRGFELHAASMRVDLNAGAATSDEPVRGHGPMGELNAEGLRVTERGDRILFTGRTRLLVRRSERAADG